MHLDLEDSTGFEAACRQGKELGMDGKTLIHPSTVAVANWFFGPSAEEVEQSYRIVEAMEEVCRTFVSEMSRVSFVVHLKHWHVTRRSTNVSRGRSCCQLVLWPYY